MNRYEKIVVLGNAVEARLMEAELKARDIPHLIRSYYDSAYDGLFQAQKGWGHVQAPKAYEEEIKTIHRDISKRAEDEPPPEGE